MWAPLLAALDLKPEQVVTPQLPGFGAPIPEGFSGAKEAYLSWLIAQLEVVAAKHGPSDVVGHDWGALLVVRAAHLRPELFRSWAVSNALPDPQYRWHQAARAWQTPLLGELGMWLGQFSDWEKALTRAGMPAAVAAAERPHIDRTMRQSILTLYRSAVHVGREWGEDLSRLPARGVVIWGDADPFVTPDVAARFCDRWSVPLKTQAGAGHWALVERPEVCAALLRAHWS
jgi:pimeloyl-ACP methyl ester carboxylesterase